MVYKEESQSSNYYFNLIHENILSPTMRDVEQNKFRGATYVRQNTHFVNKKVKKLLDN